MVVSIQSTDFKESFDEVLDDGISRVLNQYNSWRHERDKIDKSPQLYDAGAEELMRENLISKVIGIQQMFEKPKGPRLRNLWTDRRMKLIKNMGQIQSILKSMKEKPKKKKKKKPKVILPPVVESEKPKPLPEGFVNFSKLLPRVDPKTMETRSFTWSRERDTCLIDKYVGQEHMKDQALREHTLGIKPILKIDFFEDISFPLTPTWTKLPISKHDLEDERTPGHSADHKHRDPNRLLPVSRAGSRMSVVKSRHPSRQNSARDSLSRQSNRRKMSMNKLNPDFDMLQRKMSESKSRKNSIAMSKKKSLPVPGLHFNVIDEETDFNRSDSESMASPIHAQDFQMLYQFSGMSPFGISRRGSQVSNRSGMKGEGEADQGEHGDTGEPRLEVDTERYYRHWCKKQKTKQKLKFFEVSEDDSSDHEITSEDLNERHSDLKSPPPKCGLSLHESFLAYNPEDSHTKREIEKLRRRKLDELFLGLKKFAVRNIDS